MTNRFFIDRPKPRPALPAAIIIIVLFYLLAARSVFSADLIPAGEIDRIRSAVVKITNYSQRPDYDSPWKRLELSGGRGSGVIISGNRILTSAHVVSDSRYLEIEKENSGTPYRAEVAYIAHDCDLAILDVPDKSFFDDTSRLDFDQKIPRLGSMVLVYGFPAGGKRITVTRGVVSRIDYTRYSHSSRDFHLILQIDAAINSGNSGGPVLQGGKIIGISFQGVGSSENVGHVIPITVIDHFLEDIDDETYHGYPDLGIVNGNLLNPAYRDFLELPEGEEGVMVFSLLPGFSAEGLILPGDVILSIDGYPVRNDGTITIGGNRYQFSEIVERKQVGEEVALEVRREGNKIPIRVGLKKNEKTLKTWNEYESEPEYLVYGGLLFTTLSREYLKTWGRGWWNRADPRLLYYYNYYFHDAIYRNKPSIVVLSRVLSAPVNQYYADYRDEVVRKINGRPIHSISDLAAAFQNASGRFQVIEFIGDSPPIVLDAEAVERENPRILKRYGIGRDRYPPDTGEEE